MRIQKYELFIYQLHNMSLLNKPHVKIKDDNIGNVTLYRFTFVQESFLPLSTVISIISFLFAENHHLSRYVGVTWHDAPNLETLCKYAYICRYKIKGFLEEDIQL